MIKKIADIYNDFEKWFLIIAFSVMVVIIFAQVFTRYVMGNALYWSEELGKFIFVWISWIGVSAGMRYNEHIQVLMVHTALGKRGHRKAVLVLQIIVSILWFITSIIVLKDSIMIVSMQLESGVYGPSTHIPMWIPYLCLPISAAVVCLRLIFRFIEDVSELTGLSSGKDKEVAC